MALVLDAACCVNMGKLRTNNEDNLFFNGDTLPLESNGIATPWYHRFQDGTVCFGVFDGMGGMEDGQVASYLAAQSFAADCKQIQSGGLISEEFFLNAIAHMNIAVCRDAELRNNNMGSTAVAIGFSEDKVYICNVGDSRAYRFRDGQLTQISMDHVAEIPPFLGQSKRKKPKLSQCIGISPEELQIEPYVAQGGVREDDAFLLCSDGLTDMVPNEKIRMLIAEKTDVCVTTQRLIDSALEAGGKDNITVMLIRIMYAPKDPEEIE